MVREKKTEIQATSFLRTMCPFSELVGRINRVLILLVVARHGHASTVTFERMRWHALVDYVVIRDLDLTGELDVVVRELANLDVINTSSFFLFRRTEPEGGDEFANKVKSSEDKTGPEEGVCAAGERIGKLIAKLHPMVVEPTTIDNSVTIEMRNVVTA